MVDIMKTDLRKSTWASNPVKILTDPEYQKMISELKEGDILCFTPFIAWSEITMQSSRNGTGSRSR